MANQPGLASASTSTSAMIRARATPSVRLLAIWLSIHFVRRGAAIVVGTVVLAWTVGAIRVDTFGLGRFNTPFPIALFAAGVAAVGVVTASINTAHSEALRHRPVQAIWESIHTALFFVVAATLLVPPAASYGYADPWAVVRNLAITTILAMAALISGHQDQLWLPPVLATALSALFGSGGPDYTWDILLATDATPRATTVALAGLVVTVVVRSLRLR